MTSVSCSKSASSINREMSESDNTHKCLICDKYFFKIPTTKVGGSSKLEDELDAAFILRKLLSLPLAMFETSIQKEGNPSSWVICCSSCSLIVDETKTISSQIMKLQAKFDSLRVHIKNKIKTSYESKNPKECISNGMGEAKHGTVNPASAGVASEIRAYIVKTLTGSVGHPVLKEPVLKLKRLDSNLLKRNGIKKSRNSVVAKKLKSQPLVIMNPRVVLVKHTIKQLDCGKVVKNLNQKNSQLSRKDVKKQTPRKTTEGQQPVQLTETTNEVTKSVAENLVQELIHNEPVNTQIHIEQLQNESTSGSEIKKQKSCSQPQLILKSAVRDPDGNEVIQSNKPDGEEKISDHKCFYCPVCKKPFQSNFQVKRHEWNKHREEDLRKKVQRCNRLHGCMIRFKCPLCTFESTYKHSTNNHIRRLHPNSEAIPLKVCSVTKHNKQKYFSIDHKRIVSETEMSKAIDVVISQNGIQTSSSASENQSNITPTEEVSVPGLTSNCYEREMNSNVDTMVNGNSMRPNVDQNQFNTTANVEMQFNVSDVSNGYETETDPIADTEINRDSMTNSLSTNNCNTVTTLGMDLSVASVVDRYAVLINPDYFVKLEPEISELDFHTTETIVPF